MNEYFFSKIEENPQSRVFLQNLHEYANNVKNQVYALYGPLTDNKYKYSFKGGFVVLSPRKKIAFVGTRLDESFENYLDDVLEDVASLSDKYGYKEKIGRPRQWKDFIVKRAFHEISSVKDFFDNDLTVPVADQRKVDLIVSLFIGSINDISRISIEEPTDLVAKVKQKIQLFDGQQTRFIYEDLQTGDKTITIQGLSGTGKTELLLHKLKDLYLQDDKSILCFTCHNRVLAADMRKRIPEFFNFMRVDQQIDKRRILCVNAWGSYGNANSGAYRYICDFYGITFLSFREAGNFNSACNFAIRSIKEKYKEKDSMDYAFTYMFIDESQDFEDPFFDLCELVTEKNVFKAGDVFQSIFEKHEGETKPDFMLSNCYRTDPRTLMFSHALGMGLFEDTKLWWLTKDEWEQCGYVVEESGGNYKLTREPIRRFEDVDEKFKCLEFYKTTNVPSDVVKLFEKIKSEFPSVEANDIAVIFVDSDEYIYSLAPRVEQALVHDLQLETNIAYETKQKGNNSVFITNRNNAKGLEFPFVICYTRRIIADHKYRNTLYTMLTRSFIRSYLLVADIENNGFSEQIEKGAMSVMHDNCIKVAVPSAEEQEKIRLHIDTQHKAMSLRERIENICKLLEVEDEIKWKIVSTLENIKSDTSDEQLLTLISALKDNV